MEMYQRPACVAAAAAKVAEEGCRGGGVCAEAVVRGKCAECRARHSDGERVVGESEGEVRAKEGIDVGGRVDAIFSRMSRGRLLRVIEGLGV